MSRHRHYGFALAGFLALGLAGCAGTSMVHTWSDPARTGPPMQKVLVIGVARLDANRRAFEDKFKAELATHGIEAICSSTVLPGSDLNREAIAAKLKELNPDGMIITRAVDKQMVETMYPPTATYAAGSPHWPDYYSDYFGYYTTAYDVYAAPGDVASTEYVYMETNVYDARTGKLAWTGLTKTAVDSDQAGSLIKGVVGVLIEELQKAKAKQ